ncbi:dihydroxyacetone kinase [Anaerofilum sp. An201]|nr:DegV family protein [Anaerofilum sp. An201]OUP03660.1 dihydroxyacetone kinase [Anaerofilum sp. An201]
MRIALVTDTNSGIPADEARQLNIELLPMPFFIDGKVYYEGVDLSAPEFYEAQASGCNITTSQPSPGDVTALWDRLLQDHDAVVHIPMSSGLSNSCATAQMLAMEYGGRVQVADVRRISMTQRQAALDALRLIERGLDPVQVRVRLEETALRSSIYVTPDTLVYLKKGGRITPAAAAIGSVLNIKPVLQIQGGKIDAFAKVRGMRQAATCMLNALHDDLNGRFAGKKVKIMAAYSGSDEVGERWLAWMHEQFPGQEICAAPLSLSIACHTGPGAIGLGCSEYEE